jgi:hypothetical protein
MVYATTSHNRIVYASPPVGGSGWPKRHIQPERYAPFALKFFVKFLKKDIDIIYSLG